MASRIQGITVEIGGDTTKLTTALKSVNSEICNTQSQLRDVEKLLKLDPGNTELLSQKQRMLNEEVQATKEKLEALKRASEQANVSLVSIGTLNASLVEPRELFKSSILCSAASIVLCHNHPSSDILPSQSDLHLTARLKMAGEIIGIDVLDHIIVGGDNTKYFSFAENNIMPTISYLREAENHQKQISNIAKKPMAAERGKSR